MTIVTKFKFFDKEGKEVDPSEADFGQELTFDENTGVVTSSRRFYPNGKISDSESRESVQA